MPNSRSASELLGSEERIAHKESSADFRSCLERCVLAAASGDFDFESALDFACWENPGTTMNRSTAIKIKHALIGTRLLMVSPALRLQRLIKLHLALSIIRTRLPPISQ